MGDSMDQDKLRAIKELMDELVGEMEPSGEDFDMRLGKPKVDVVAMKADSGDMPMEGDLMDSGPEGDMDMEALMGGSPEDKFKQRLMKLKG